MEIEAEEARRKAEQARIDEELAKRLQLTEVGIILYYIQGVLK